MDVNQKYKYTDAIDSVIEKDWAAGSKNIITTSEYVISAIQGTFVAKYRKVSYAHAWLKTIDEPLVNAIDQFVGRGLTPAKDRPVHFSQVTKIAITFDKMGKVKITNDGHGVEVEIHSEASAIFKEQTYVPELIFGRLHQGSNRVKAADSIVGGTNGFGAKISNCFSTSFVIETVDPARKKYYIQKWTNHMKTKTAPQIIDLAAPHALTHAQITPHTTLSFIPDYKLFGYELLEDNSLSPEVFAELNDLILTRVYMAAAYLSFAAASLGCKPPTITFNSLPIAATLITLAKLLFPAAEAIPFIVTPNMTDNKLDPAYHYKWEAVAVIIPNDGDITEISNVNGIVVSSGTHTKWLNGTICAALQESVAKELKEKNMKFRPSFITKNLFLLVNAQIPNPSWTGQRKDILTTSMTKFGHYGIPNAIIMKLTAALKTQVTEYIFNESDKTMNKKIKNANDDFEKYEDASEIKAAPDKCALLTAEGDSALNHLRIGLVNSIGLRYFGLFSLGGVIINVRKHSNVIMTSTGERRIQAKATLRDNVVFAAFCRIVGLSTQYEYNPAKPEFKSQWASVRYRGGIIVCVDQDYDGIGNIFSLLLNMFELFWPNLLKAGFIKRFNTPLRRAYPKNGGRVLSFYTDAEYNNWISTVDADNYYIKYFKGLGSHNDDEMINMCENFAKHTLTYSPDEKTPELFNIYFGKEPDLRKVALARPVVTPSLALLQKQIDIKQVLCSDHLEFDTVLFQKDSIKRHVDSAIDGLNQGGRMIIDGSIKYFAKKAAKGKNKTFKVAQLAGFVAETENYHHGEACIADSITGKALICVGGRQLPLLLPDGNFGSRYCGGSGAASPRYICTSINKRITDLLFPAIDYTLLEFNFDEGERCEPKYFIPIIPTAILESAELPGHGWKLKLWGRDINDVIAAVRKVILMTSDIINAQSTSVASGTNVPQKIDYDLLRSQLAKVYINDLRPNLLGWRGKIKFIKGNLYTVGDYYYNSAENKVYITELPLRTWTKKYVIWLKKETLTEDGSRAGLVADIIDFSAKNKIDIRITLQADAAAKIGATYGSAVLDPMEEFLGLAEVMNSNINLIGAADEVIEFQKYEEVIKYWFPFRAQIYHARIEREIILITMKIMRQEQIIKYIEVKAVMSKLEIAQMIKFLEDNGFIKLHNKKINNPKFTPVAELESVILTGKANYDYLLDLTDRQKSAESLAKYKQQLDDLRNALVELKTIKISDIWGEELDALEKVVKYGQQTDWKYENAGKYSYK